MRLLSLFTEDNSKMYLRGRAIAYTDVRLFLDALNKSDMIGPASLVETRKNSSGNGMIDYSIDCSLAQKKDIENGR